MEKQSLVRNGSRNSLFIDVPLNLEGRKFYEFADERSLTTNENEFEAIIDMMGSFFIDNQEGRDLARRKRQEAINGRMVEIFDGILTAEGLKIS